MMMLKPPPLKPFRLRPTPNWKEIRSPIPNSRAFRWGDLSVIVGKEPTGWHISVAHPQRYPTWDEIKAARYDHTPHDITMAMILPPIEEYVNLHEHCFHLYQIRGEKRKRGESYGQKRPATR
jgi:hypothetical protein